MSFNKTQELSHTAVYNYSLITQNIWSVAISIFKQQKIESMHALKQLKLITLGAIALWHTNLTLG